MDFNKLLEIIENKQFIKISDNKYKKIYPKNYFINITSPIPSHFYNDLILTLTLEKTNENDDKVKLSSEIKNLHRTHRIGGYYEIKKLIENPDRIDMIVTNYAPYNYDYKNFKFIQLETFIKFANHGWEYPNNWDTYCYTIDNKLKKKLSPRAIFYKQLRNTIRTTNTIKEEYIIIEIYYKYYDVDSDSDSSDSSDAHDAHDTNSHQTIKLTMFRGDNYPDYDYSDFIHEYTFHNFNDFNNEIYNIIDYFDNFPLWEEIDQYLNIDSDVELYSEFSVGIQNNI